MREYLHDSLLQDLRAIGIQENFNLDIKPYSKTFFGRYNPNTDTVILYVYQDKDCSRLYDYEDLLLTAIHEIVHYIQWHDPNFTRRKGIMHDPEFYSLYNEYADRAKALLLLKEVRSAKFSVPSVHQVSTVCSGVL